MLRKSYALGRCTPDLAISCVQCIPKSVGRHSRAIKRWRNGNMTAVDVVIFGQRARPGGTTRAWPTQASKALHDGQHAGLSLCYDPTADHLPTIPCRCGAKAGGLSKHLLRPASKKGSARLLGTKARYESPVQGLVSIGPGPICLGQWRLAVAPCSISAEKSSCYQGLEFPDPIPGQISGVPGTRVEGFLLSRLERPGGARRRRSGPCLSLNCRQHLTRMLPPLLPAMQGTAWPGTTSPSASAHSNNGMAMYHAWPVSRLPLLPFSWAP